MPTTSGNKSGNYNNLCKTKNSTGNNAVVMHNTQSVPDLQERYRPSLTDEFSQKDADCFELILTDDIVDLMPQEQKSARRTN